MPFQRIAYWNKFGSRRGYVTRTGDYRDIPSLWWFDPDKAQRWKRAMADDSIKLDAGPTEVRYWPDYERGAPVGARRGAVDQSLTAYFLRRFLLIIPTFLGITLAVFVIMHFVPGGPVERQIMRYAHGGDGEAAAPAAARASSRFRKRPSSRSGSTTASTSRSTSATRCGCGTSCTSISATPTSTRIRCGT